MTFKKLSEYFQKLEETSSRLKITEILADLFKECSVEEIDKICYLSLGRLLPAYEGVEFQMAEKMLIKAVSKAFGATEEKVLKEFKKEGDLGNTAEKFKQQGKERVQFDVNGVYERLMEIAKEKGEGSVERKIAKMAFLLNELDLLSVRYVARIPLGKLRLGFSEMTILDALSWTLVGDKSKREEIEAAYNVRANIGQIAKELKTKNLKLKTIDIKPQVGIPVMPALCQRLPTAEEMIKKMGRVAVEPKFDGQRLMVHFGEKLTRIFTRNLENVTQMFPDIVQALAEEVRARQVILDGEAIGFDPKTGKFLPFQETIKRKRKYEIGKKAKEIPLKYFVFDILYKDGRDLLNMPFSQRREILEKTLSSGNQTILLSPQIVTDKADVLRQFHDEQIKKGFEGVVAKKWEASYDPGRRGFTWVKLKSEKGKKGGGLADTVDCVIMGIYKGKGKRAGFGVGAFLVGVKQSDKFVTVSKIGTGLTDEQFRQLKVQSASWRTKFNKKPKDYEVDKNMTPDMWLEPKLIVEIQADNITESPIHTAGLALRFPRLVRFRDDKLPEQATTVGELERLYQLQFSKET